MFAFLPAPLRGALAALLLTANTLWWCLPLFVLALVRLALPFPAVLRALDPLLNGIATTWVAGNSGWMRLTQRTHWDTPDCDGLDVRSWYLVVCNHQSWADIFVLQHVFNRRIPMLKFFLKRELIFVPVIGLAWWALDFPFMRRHSDAELRRHPKKRFDDLEVARRACARFARVPTSVMNFVEGTRFSAGKHAAQHSPFRHLLRPKAGGLAVALATLADRVDAVLDATIVYPDGVPGFWDFLCGRTGRVVVRAERLAIPHDLLSGIGLEDPALRKRVQRWLSGLWQRKDALIDVLRST
ncbi:MAG: acyltransferase [Ideonella sp.]|nr:acyltransferase [Ideonella sp.]MCC7456482.1 acyltransferase [Nitrospira sp.]